MTLKLAALETGPAAFSSWSWDVCVPAGIATLSWLAETGVIAAGWPSKVAEVTPERFEPWTVTVVPTDPAVGVKLDTLGGSTTVRLAPLVLVPAGVVTETWLVVAVIGTGTTMCESSATTKPGATSVPNLTAVAPSKVEPSTRSMRRGSPTTA